jgi:hypothetical protein
MFEACAGTHSSGYCSGFSPDSLFFLRRGRGIEHQLTFAKIAKSWKNQNFRCKNPKKSYHVLPNSDPFRNARSSEIFVNIQKSITFAL